MQPDPNMRTGQSEDGIGTLVERLRGDAVEYGRAQLAVYKAEVSVRAAPARSGAVLAVSAAILANAALIALLMGLIFTLSTLVGPGGATAIVVIVSFGVAGLLGWLAAGKFRAAFGNRV